MSLSRPVKFPLLKLPWLCIKCVIQNSDLFNIIYFATISNRTRRIVQHSKYPLKDIVIHLQESKQISMGDRKSWNFLHYEYEFSVPLVLQRNSRPFPTSEHLKSWKGPHLQSRTTGDTLVPLKMGIDFMIDVFGCAIETVFVDGNELSKLIRLGISSVKILRINGPEPVNLTDLKYLLENVKVTDRCVFNARIPADFYCEPQIFKSRQMSFLYNHSADWVTLELICQFDVAQLDFWYNRFSVEDIVSYVTHWFNSENRKLEYAQFKLHENVSQEDFKIDHLNPMPFCEKRRNRYPFVEGWEDTDMSSGKDILRQDGLLATFYVDSTSVIFYIWHKRFSDAVQQ